MRTLAERSTTTQYESRLEMFSASSCTPVRFEMFTWHNQQLATMSTDFKLQPLSIDTPDRARGGI